MEICWKMGLHSMSHEIEEKSLHVTKNGDMFLCVCVSRARARASVKARARARVKAREKKQDSFWNSSLVDNQFPNEISALKPSNAH